MPDENMWGRETRPDKGPAELGHEPSARPGRWTRAAPSEAGPVVGTDTGKPRDLMLDQLPAN